jgi:hypothetical protein
MGEMLFSSPFHVVGIGQGASVAAAFAGRYGRQARFRNALRAVVCINGYTSVDAQLAAIYSSASKVFNSFSESRPDLPVQYWTKFLFSEQYISERVPLNLALNIYTAVGNPITLEGRVKQCKAALASSDVAPLLQPSELPVPLVLLQSTENALVNASNVDPFLEGRAASHLWSHQLQLGPEEGGGGGGGVSGGVSGGGAAGAGASSLGKRGTGMLLDALSNPKGAFVMWVKAGHEVRQERKRVLQDLLEVLCFPVPVSGQESVDTGFENIEGGFEGMALANTGNHTLNNVLYSPHFSSFFLKASSLSFCLASLFFIDLQGVHRWRAVKEWAQLGGQLLAISCRPTTL